MANRDLLKEAIADAKTIKETAIANAKAALEEAFTPQLQSMLSQKIQEMEEEEVTESEEVTEGDDSEQDDVVEESQEIEETQDLDELLANEGQVEESADLAPEIEVDVEDEVAVDAGIEGEAEMEVDLEDMSEDDLKMFIEDVIKDLVATGELTPVDDELGLDAEMGDELDLDMGDEEIGIDDEESVDMMMENFMQTENDVQAKAERASQAGLLRKLFGVDSVGELMAALGGAAGSATGVGSGVHEMGAPMAEGGDVKAKAEQAAQTGVLQKLFGVNSVGELMAALGGAAGSATGVGSGVHEMGAPVAEYSQDQYADNSVREELDTLRAELNEVNLLNAKLLYTNKLFKAHTLNESQKANVLTTFDKAETIKEVKLVFETLSVNVKGSSPKKTIKENLGSSSKSAGVSMRKQPIVETNDIAARFQKLAGITKS